MHDFQGFSPLLDDSVIVIEARCGWKAAQLMVARMQWEHEQNKREIGQGRDIPLGRVPHLTNFFYLGPTSLYTCQSSSHEWINPLTSLALSINESLGALPIEIIAMSLPCSVFQSLMVPFRFLFSRPRYRIYRGVSDGHSFDSSVS